MELPHNLHFGAFYKLKYYYFLSKKITTQNSLLPLYLLKFYNMPVKVCDACICCFDGCDFDNVMIGYGHKGDCLCLTGESCLALGEEHLGVGMVTNENNKECCKLGLFCCTLGLKTPDKLCSDASK